MAAWLRTSQSDETGPFPLLVLQPHCSFFADRRDGITGLPNNCREVLFAKLVAFADDPHLHAISQIQRIAKIGLLASIHFRACVCPPILFAKFLSFLDYYGFGKQRFRRSLVSRANS
jgi:hypothetical protein